MEAHLIDVLRECKTTSGAARLAKINIGEAEGVMDRAVRRGLLHREEILQDDQIARLMSFPNVLITAHQAFFTREALAQIASTTLRNLEEYETGKVLTNEVIYAEVK